MTIDGTSSKIATFNKRLIQRLNLVRVDIYWSSNKYTLTLSDFLKS